MNDRCFVVSGKTQPPNGVRGGTVPGKIAYVAFALVLIGPGPNAPAADRSPNVRDIDIKSIADLEKMSTDAVRNVVITKAGKEMSEKDIAVTKAVYTARLGTEVAFDRDEKSFVVVRHFFTRDAAMEVVAHVISPEDVTFVGVPAFPYSTAEARKDKGYRVILDATFRKVVPGKEEREGIARAIAKDEEARPPEPKRPESKPPESKRPERKPTAATPMLGTASIPTDAEADSIRVKLDTARRV